MRGEKKTDGKKGALFYNKGPVESEREGDGPRPPRQERPQEKKKSKNASLENCKLNKGGGKDEGIRREPEYRWRQMFDTTIVYQKRRGINAATLSVGASKMGLALGKH